MFEGLTYEAAAARSGYSTATLRSAVRDFRRETGFFLNPRPGPTRAPAKNAAREKILALRRAGHSAKEISQLVADTATPLNRTGVAQVINEAGLRFLSTPGTIENDGNTITVHLRRRTYSPVLRAAAIPDTTIPWWGNRTLHFEYD